MDADYQTKPAADQVLSFDQKLVAKIKEEKMAPRPRWHFLLKNYVIWATGLLSLLIGAAAVSVMIYLLKYNDWEIYDQTKHGFGEFILMTLPYFWLLFLALFVYILYYNFKHTKRGYRYPVWLIALLSVLASALLGLVFFLSGLGEQIDDVLGAQAPWYEKVLNQQIPFWFSPSEGRLTGIVIDRGVDNEFTIIDPAGALWQVDLAANNLSAYKEVVVGVPVRIIGQSFLAQASSTAANTNHFSAKVVHAAHPGHGFFERPGMRRHLPVPVHCAGDQCLVVPGPPILGPPSFPVGH
jgi:hypothetical protein